MNDAVPANDEPGARCFIALLPDAAALETLQRCRESLEHACVGITRSVRWTEPCALHLTLRFLGASSPAQIERCTRALPLLARPLPATITSRYGIWPNRSRPRLLVLELTADPALSALARDCEAQAQTAGFASERCPFRAHVTLARLRPGSAFGILPRPPATISFAAIALVQSQLAQPHASYTELVRAPLPPATAQA